MEQKITAVFENGILRPLQAVQGLNEHSRVDITITSAESDQKVRASGSRLGDLVGSISKADGAEMMKIIDEEFSKVDARDW